jgi:hypothetical protein
MKVYLLYYDTDGSGNREEWSVFYTPCEAFPDTATRDKRKAFITSKRPDLVFEEETLVIKKTHDFPFDF